MLDYQRLLRSGTPFSHCLPERFASHPARMKRRFSIIATGGMMIALGCVTARAAKFNFGDLVNNSPFGVHAAATTEAPAEGCPELRGVVVEGDKYLFCLYDPIARVSSWVTMNEPIRAYTVCGYDAANDSVTVAYKGRTLSLVLKRAKVVLVAPSLPRPAPGMDKANSVSADQSAALFSSGEDASRIVLMREDIRRRRALRQQSAQSAQPPESPNN